MLNYADLIVAIVLLIFIVLGIRQGLIRTLLGILAFFVAVLISEAVMLVFKSGIPALVSSGNFVAAALFFGIWFISFVLLEMFFSILFGKVVEIQILEKVDKLLGALIGAYKGILIVGFIVLILIGFPLAPQTMQLMRGSRLTKTTVATYEYCVPFARKVQPRVNLFFKETVFKKIDVSKINNAIPVPILEGDTKAFEKVTDPEKKYLDNIPQLRGMKIEDAQKLLEKYQKEQKNKQK